MSWDLYIDGEWIGNYTHNTNVMIRAASVAPSELGPQPSVGGEVLFREPVLGTCWKDFDGRPAYEVARFAEDIVSELRRNPEKYDAMAPSNHWGDRMSLIKFMLDVAKRCDENPNAKFEASG